MPARPITTFFIPKPKDRSAVPSTQPTSASLSCVSNSAPLAPATKPTPIIRTFVSRKPTSSIPVPHKPNRVSHSSLSSPTLQSNTTKTSNLSSSSSSCSSPGSTDPSLTTSSLGNATPPTCHSAHKSTTGGEVEGAPQFPFPFPPYPIQEEFMKELYNTLEKGNVGIFESPTGTGKSLSIICSALTWLKHQHDPTSVDEVDDTDVVVSPNEPAWMVEYAKKRKREQMMKEQESRDRHFANQQKRVRRYTKTTTQPKVAERGAKRRKTKIDREDSDSDLIAQHSDMDTATAEGGTIPKGLYSSSESSHGAEDDEEDPYVIPKVFYSSRTHTQLNQFVKEIAKTDFWKDPQIRVVQLGSRPTFCINDKVRRQAGRNSHRINELCLDLQRSKPAKKPSTRLSEFDGPMDDKKETPYGCPYMDRDAIKLMKDHIHVESRDIEDIVKLGKKLNACPYYASRAAIPSATVVTLPYQSLLSEPTRQALGIDLQDSVVLVDEAHNIIDSIANTFSAEVTYMQVNQGVLQLGEYLTRYSTRLLPKNKANVKALLQLLKKFLAVLKNEILAVKEAELKDSPSMTMMGINDFVFQLNIDNINLYEITTFIQESEIIRKLTGILEKQKKEQDAPGLVQIHSHKSASQIEYSLDEFHITQLHSIERFLDVIMNSEENGRILLIRDKDHTQNKLKFILLNPSVYFDEVVKASRAVVLAGGTMQPVDLMVDELFPTLPQTKVDLFSCDHVVPKENLVAVSLDVGPSGMQFDFTYGKRSSPEMIRELGRLLCNLVNIVPDGVVIFFPSYAYEEQVYNQLKDEGTIAKIGQKKRFMREPRKADEVHSVLQDYEDTILRGMDRQKTRNEPPTLAQASSRGAVLSCVIGGKMSEGINFGDHLGRCIVIVGLPYAPPNDPVLKEKVGYLVGRHHKKNLAEGYHDNSCMKGVNQSIGRAIRHIKDYASIVMVDHRYSKPRIQSRLPKWILKSAVHHSTFPAAFQTLRSFYTSKMDAR